MGKTVELLSPAGNYEAFLGALNAGADAVYLGGEKFGARAYADNFDKEQIVRALHVAHFYGKKIYLTVNTLLKEKELATLYAYILPFYEAGLDGVIVQDYGVLRYLLEHFPGLSLHASTQMAVTGVRGAALLKEWGVSRIVPARELSLKEVQKIRDEAGVEVECFIHGAMCYCYSGQCLFSSILGGRSGNRGRCAQPCRLLYGVLDGKKQLLQNAYPLSLKDMCTLEYLPTLLAAGIDSFKIEGRMKRPEYAAGVTAVYRKYIDLYYREGPSGFRIDPADLDRIRGLYIRSELQTGYYERHNGKEMVSLENPGYSKSDEHILAQIRKEYVREPDKMPVRLQADVKAGDALRLRIFSESEVPAVVSETVGEQVQAAQNAPLTAEEVSRRLCKMGGTLLNVKGCEIRMEDGCFVPVRALNELRRQAVEAFEIAVTESRGRLPVKELTGGEPAGKAPPGEELAVMEFAGEELAGKELTEEELAKKEPEAVENDREGLKNIDQPSQSIAKPLKYAASPDRPQRKLAGGQEIHCLVTTLEQLRAVAAWGGLGRIYIESDLLYNESEKVRRILEDVVLAGGRGEEPAGSRTACYLAFPYVLRRRDGAYLQKLGKEMEKAGDLLQGFLVRNLEALSYAGHLLGEWGGAAARHIVSDAGLYCFNSEAIRFLSGFVEEITLPYELNAGEAAHLVRAAKSRGVGTNLIVYGRIPMMITANCLQKTAGRCGYQEKGNGRLLLKDRTGAAFPVAVNCDHCYNVIYNAVPYSLHGAKKERDRIGAKAHRYDFVAESGAQCLQILEGHFPFAEYTAGHCRRGVE